MTWVNIKGPYRPGELRHRHQTLEPPLASMESAQEQTGLASAGSRGSQDVNPGRLPAAHLDSSTLFARLIGGCGTIAGQAAWSRVTLGWVMTQQLPPGTLAAT